MHHTPRLRAAMSGAVLVFALASPAAATWSTSPFTSLPLCTFVGQQSTPVIVSDGAGGVFVAWLDDRGAYSVYATHVTHDGVVVSGWPVNGLGVCTAGGGKNNIRLVPGATGDVIVLWEDQRAGNSDIYAQRVLGNGTIAPGWPANGLALTSDVRNQNQMCAATDGAGGAYVAWTLEYTPGTDYDIYATRVLPTGAIAPGFAVDGIPINPGTYVQDEPAITADGAGNAIIVYANEDATKTAVIWGQKLTPAGGRAWGSVIAGLQLSSITNDQRTPLVVADGTGGSIFSDLFSGVEAYYGLIDGNGTLRDYHLETLPSGGSNRPTLVADGAAGAWATLRTGNTSTCSGYVEHLDARLRPTTPSSTNVFSGWCTDYYPVVVPMPGSSAIYVWSMLNDDVRAEGFDTNLNPLWGSSNVMVAGAPGTQSEACAAWDGVDGAIVAWSDSRNGTSTSNIYAARVDRFGAIGNASPAFTKLGDVPNDQGGFVSLQWTGSYLDAAPTFPIARYSIWRRAPGGLPTLRGAASTRMIGANEARPEGAARVIRAETAATGVVFWEYLSQVPARGYAGYSAVAPTTSDSTVSSNPRTSFRIEAESATGIPYWDSNPDSTYSVDNLAPAAPAPFTGTYSNGTTLLVWQANTEPDLGVYRLYRGSSPAFVPSQANLVTQQTQTGYSDPAGAPYWYKLAAVDVHGNVSPFSTLLPAGVTAVDGSPFPRELALASPAPNPALGSIVLHFALPRAGNLTLAIYDTAGRRVRSLANGPWPAGEHALAWDGRTESGARVGAGLYFARLEADGRVLERRMAMIR